MAIGSGPRIWRLPERARRVIWQAAGYEPSPEQLACHLDPHRLKLAAGGERAGKSKFSALEMLCWLMASDGLFWIVGPDYELARPEMLHLADAAGRCDLIAKDGLSLPRQGACVLRTKLGAEIATKTAQDVKKLAGRAPTGILMVEAAQQDFESYLRCRGRVAETRGPLALSGTFEGSLGWYADLWRAWQSANTDGGRSFSLPTWSNRAIFPGGRDDPEIRALEATYPADVFMERFGATPCPPATIVFKEFSHVLHVKATPESGEYQTCPLQVWVDPGWQGAYAALFVALVHGEVWVIDEVYGAGLTAQEVIARAQGKPFWPRVKGGVIDIAGRQHQGMESHVEIWRRLARLNLQSNPVGIADGILRHRTFLKDPGSGQPRLFHDPQCKGTIAEYGRYRYPDVKENRPEREDPIDANNHAMKALAYGLVANFGFVAPPSLPQVKVTYRR